MTPGQQAIADGFAATLAVHGQTWVRTRDAASFTGSPAKLKKDDAKMQGTQDRDFPVLVADLVLSPTIPAVQCMPAAPNRLRVGDELTKSVGTVAKYYRVVRADYSEATGLWLCVFSPSF